MAVRFIKEYKYSPTGTDVVTVGIGEKSIGERWENKAIKGGYAVKCGIGKSVRKKRSTTKKG